VASIPELLSLYENAEALAEAEDALDQIAAMEQPENLRLGDYYDELAEVASEEGAFMLAVRAQSRAIELGCELPELAHDMLAWYLLKAGDRDKGEAAFARLRAERVGDPQIVSTLANARMDSGDGKGALAAYDEALDLAKRAGDYDWIGQLRSERRYFRFEHGLSPDEDDRLVEWANPAHSKATHFAVAWFPRDQIEAALARWPLLVDDLNDPDAYCRTIETRLRAVRSETGREPSVAPLQVERLVEFAAEKGVDPDSGAARSHFAAALEARESPWPGRRAETSHAGATQGASTSAAAVEVGGSRSAMCRRPSLYGNWPEQLMQEQGQRLAHRHRLGTDYVPK
jgi:tetratricopeptide (TPR) repeat protein